MTPVSPSRDQEQFRTFTLWLSGVLTLVWAGLTMAGLAEVLPGQRGYGALAAVLVSIVFVVFILPALLLAYFNRLLGVAFALAVLGLVCYAYDPILRLIAFLGK